jgi:hypothetical protein
MSLLGRERVAENGIGALFYIRLISKVLPSRVVTWPR